MFDLGIAAGAVLPPLCAIKVNPAIVLPVVSVIAALMFVAVRKLEIRVRRLLRASFLVNVGFWLVLTIYTTVFPRPCRYTAMDDLRRDLANVGAHPGFAIAGYSLGLFAVLLTVSGAFAVKEGWKTGDAREKTAGYWRIFLSVISLLSIDGIVHHTATAWGTTRMGNVAVAVCGLAAAIWLPNLLVRMLQRFRLWFG